MVFVRKCINEKNFGYATGLCRRSTKGSMAWNGWETQRREPFEYRGNMAVDMAGAWMMLLCFKHGLCTPANTRKVGIFPTLESGRRISGVRWMLCLILKRYEERAVQGERMLSKSTGWPGHFEVEVGIVPQTYCKEFKSFLQWRHWVEHIRNSNR